MPLVLLVLYIICNFDFSGYYLWRILGCNRVWYTIEKVFDKNNLRECDNCIMLNIIIF